MSGGAIGPGDWVECIDVSPAWASGAPCPLTMGGVYLVDRVAYGFGGDPYVWLAKGSPEWRPWGTFFPRYPLKYVASRFRPIHRPSESTFVEDLLKITTPAHLKELEPA